MIAALAVRVGVEPKNLLKIWNGQTKRPQSKTARGLAVSFKPFEPDIAPEHFHAATLDAFKNRPRHVDTVQLVVPGYAQSLSRLERTLCGTYVAYRYPFEGEDERTICREAVRIWRSGNDIRFRMSYLPKEDGEVPAREFTGCVVKIDETLMFIGTCDAHDDIRARGRCLFVSDQPETSRVAAFGILSSTRLYLGSPPCASCVVLVRTSTDVPEGKAYEDFMKDVTRQLSIPEILGKDFLQDDIPRVRIFLDNRPRGTLRNSDDPLDAELIVKDDNEGGGRDPVIRLHLDRFVRFMPFIVRRALAEPDLRPVFRIAPSPAK